jgi:hypothetical protein
MRCSKQSSVGLIHQSRWWGTDLLIGIHAPGLINSKYSTGIVTVKKEIRK